MKLLIAIQSNNLDAVRTAIVNVQPAKEYPTGWPLVIAATDTGNIAIIRILIKEGMNIYAGLIRSTALDVAFF